MKNPLIVIALIVGLVVGFGIGASLGGDSSELAKLESQIEKAKQFFPTMPEMFSVYGTVKEVKDNSVVIETISSGNPFEELPTMREVVVTGDTVIVRQSQKDFEVFQKEQEKYQEDFDKAQKQSMSDASAMVEFPMPPNPFEEKEITVDKIKAGDQITAESGGENIKTAERFEATRIMVQSSPAAAGAAPAPTSTP